MLGEALKHMLFTYGTDRDIFRSLQVIFKLPIYVVYGDTCTSGVALISDEFPAEDSNTYNKLLPCLGKQLFLVTFGTLI